MIIGVPREIKPEENVVAETFNLPYVSLDEIL